MKTISARVLLAGLKDDCEDIPVSAVVTDSRRIQPGCVFVCFPGARVDGHDFAAQAIRGGAAYIVGQHPVEGVPDSRLVRVDSSLHAMVTMGRNYRALFHPTVVGVTGSVGKTTTKEFCYAVFSAFGETLKTEGNQNNEIGCPNTLFRLEDSTRFAVVEMGMSARGEISRLTGAARPDVGIITCIGVSHMETLGSRENIRAAKLELCEGMPENAPLVLNADDPWLASAALPAHVRPVWVGIDSPAAAIRAENIRPQADSISFTIRDAANGCFETTIPAIGRHNIYNALSAYAAGVSAGLDPAGAAAALQNYRTTGMRQHVVKRRGVTVMEDCYNASPDSMRAAFSTLAQLPARRRCALVGDMLELGAVSKQAHAEVGRLAAETGVEVLVCYGPQSRLSAEEARRAGVAQVVWCQTPAEAVGALHRLVQSGDALLAKASRGMKLEDILANFYRLGE